MVNSVLWVESMPSLRNIRPSSNTRSTPPTSSRFRYSSLATRRYRSVSRALWWVTNGRARAPPGTGLRIGVSTSRKPRASIDSRRDRTTRERTRMARMAAGLTARSSSRWRERTSTSVRPFHLSGRGRRALPSRYTSVALTDSSPFLVFMTGPWTPTQSPTSRSITTSNCSAPRAPTVSMTWSSWPSWRRVQKAEAAHVPLEHHPAGDPDDVAGLLPVAELVVPAPADLGQGVGAPEADREGVDPGRPQPGQLLAARLLDRRAVFVVWHGSGGSSGGGRCGRYRSTPAILPEEPPSLGAQGRSSSGLVVRSSSATTVPVLRVTRKLTPHRTRPPISR